jgi:hypothetical protein
MANRAAKGHGMRGFLRRLANAQNMLTFRKRDLPQVVI